jgi:hypothetical protein
VSADLVLRAGALLRLRGLAEEVTGHAECRVGGNNRVLRLDTDRGPFVAKLYFTHADDRRDRLRAEYGLLEYASRLGLSAVPAPVAADPGQHLALYEYVEGTALAPAALRADHVAQAIAFFRALNAGERAGAEALPAASDACFTIEDHLQIVERRLDRLRALPIEEPIDAEAATLVREIGLCWKDVRRAVAKGAVRSGLRVDEELEARERCVSPSDFGFHNALVRPSGEVVFLDFEYAGWDDPAKAIGDFLCQPQVPVPLGCFERVTAGFTAHSSGPALAARARILLPACWVKWCLLRLGEFTPEAQRRRLFARPERDVAALKRERLEEARRALAALPGLGAALEAGGPPA